MADEDRPAPHSRDARAEAKAAQKYELERLPLSAAKRTFSQRLTELVRADRVANGIAERVREAMEAR